MPRNGSGSYSLPEAPFVSNTVISSTAVNSDFSDIGTALTGSLARDGQGGMTDVLPLGQDGLNYVIDPDTGIYRTNANTQAIKSGGVDIVTISPTGVAVTGTSSATGGITGLGSVPIGLGPLPWPTATAPTGWLLCFGQSLLRASYPELYAVIGTIFGSVDSVHFTMPDLRGNIPVGNTAMGGGSPTTNLTSAYFGANPAVIATVGGSQSNTLIESGLPSLTKNVAFSNASVQSNTGGGPNGGNTALSQSAAAGNNNFGLNVAGTITIGGGLPHANVQPGIITNYIIYAGV